MGSVSAQQVQTRYLSIIIVADNGGLRRFKLPKETKTESFKVRCARHVRSRGAAQHDASLCSRPYAKNYAHNPLSSFVLVRKKRSASERKEVYIGRARLIDAAISNAHRTGVRGNALWAWRVDYR